MPEERPAAGRKLPPRLRTPTFVLLACAFWSPGLNPNSEVGQLLASACSFLSMNSRGRLQLRRGWVFPPHPSPRTCHSDRRDGGFGRPGAEVRFSIARFLCDESLLNFGILAEFVFPPISSEVSRTSHQSYHWTSPATNRQCALRRQEPRQ